jgi:hypothetical protein
MDPEHWLGRAGGLAEGRKKNSDMVYFRHKLGCRTASNAFAVVINVWQLSIYLFI